MRNITITLDEEVARWARIRAAEQEMSLSRFVSTLLRERMLGEESYAVAMQQYWARSPRRLKRPGAAYPKRADLYAR